MSLNDLFIPFPSQLMSTARAADKMPLNFARELQNMYTGLDGAGSKRNGVLKHGNALSITLEDNFIRLFSYIKQDGDFQLLAQTKGGKIYAQNEENWAEIYTGLTVNTPLRTAQQAGKLIFCNGVDDVLMWNGETVEAVQQDIPEQGANLTYQTVNSFKVASDTRFYENGTPITATLTSGDVTTTSTGATEQPDGSILVTLADDVLDNTISAVSFTLKPPKFHTLYAAHDRLWGFGEGVIAAENLRHSGR